jgi:putative ABC transport system permease protein
MVVPGSNCRGKSAECVLLWITGVRLDLRAALRSMTRSPGFFLGAVLTLGLGLGAVTTAFGLLAGALGDSGLGSSADPVVLYLTERVNGREQRMRWPYAGVRHLRETSQSFDRIATYTIGTLNLTGTGESARIDIEFVSPEYFDVTGVRPVVGRAAGAEAEIVIGHALWQRSFGGMPSALGQTLSLAREPLTIVGVMPEGFRGLSGRAEAFVPHTMSPRIGFAGYFTSEEYFHNAIATLKPGVDVASAQSELTVLAGRMAAVVPSRSEDATDRGGLLMPLSQARTSASAVRARAYVAAGAILVLLIAGVNLANLVSTRVGARQREFGVRMAVGAGRLDLVRTVGVEMGLVAIGGFGLALVLSAWTRDFVLWLVPAGLASASNDYGQIASFRSLEIDGGVTAVVAILALLTMAGASLLATRTSLRGDLVATLKSGGDRSSTRGPGLGERVLLVVQVAASLGLIASAGLVLKSVNALDRVNPGFNTDRVIAFSVAEDLAVQRPATGPQLVDRMLAGLGQIRGVEAITAGQCTPFGSRCARLGFSIEGRPETIADPLPTGWHRVGPDHFSALGIPVIRGRGFTADDRRGRAPVVTINQAAARRYFPDQDPIGRRITLPDAIPGDPAVAEIVGIVGDVIYWPPDESPGPDVYQPALQFSYPYTTVMVRVSPEQWRRPLLGPSSAQPMFDTLRRALAEVDPNLPMFDAVTLDDLARAGRADRRFVSVLLTACAILALLLAAVGIYGLTAAWFQSRRKELGVRVALGANPASLVRIVMAGALLQTVIGVVIGIALAAGAGRALRAILYGVGPNDPAALAFSATLMLAVAALAAWLPARRALRIDPVEQLRSD